MYQQFLHFVAEHIVYQQFLHFVRRRAYCVSTVFAFCRRAYCVSTVFLLRCRLPRSISREHSVESRKSTVQPKLILNAIAVARRGKSCMQTSAIPKTKCRKATVKLERSWTAMIRPELRSGRLRLFKVLAPKAKATRSRNNS